MSHDRYSDDNPYAVIEALKTNMAWSKRREEDLKAEFENSDSLLRFIKK